VAPLEPGTLYNDDNLDRLGTFPDESVDLIYLDPPFFSNRVYEVIWGDEAEVRSFEDRWEGGIQHYIGWMRERVDQLHRVLKPTGSLYLHCDPHASHYLKVMLDQVFGGALFRNEVVWKRTTAHSSAKRYGPVHDLIYYYGRSKNVTWNAARTEYEEEYLDRYYKFDDGDGRLYWRADLCAAGTRKGQSGAPWRGLDPAAKGMHWKFTIERLDELDKEGRIYWPAGGTRWPQYKRYREELKGKAVDDVWTDIDRINPKAAERLGYPTQKPEALLERIILASSNPGDVVLDPFCGCGTTVAVAERLKRGWIGIDISPTAMEIMQRRLWNQSRVVPTIVGAPDSLDDLKGLKPFEFQNWVINKIHGTHSPRKSGDMGIDGFTFLDKSPVQVKQSESVGRNVVDNFETAIRRVGNDTGYIFAFSFTKGSVEEAARAKWEERLDIRLVRIGTLLKPEEQRPMPLRRPEGDVVPLPPMRKPNELPSAEELIESDTATG
jgi:DNA modification methylase